MHKVLTFVGRRKIFERTSLDLVVMNILSSLSFRFGESDCLPPEQQLDRDSLHGRVRQVVELHGGQVCGHSAVRG